MSSPPTDNAYQDRVNNVTDLRECLSGAREQIEIVRRGANRVYMWQQRGLQLNRGVTRHEHNTTAALSEIEQEAHDIHQNVQEGQNNLEEMDIDSSPSDGPSQSTAGSASPDPDPAPAADPVAVPTPVAPLPVAPPPVVPPPVVPPPVVPPLVAPPPVAPANNLPTANYFINNAPALIATVPAQLQARARQRCANLIARSVALAQAAAAAAAASPNDADLLAKSQFANNKVIRDRSRANLQSRVCPHCRRIHDFNDNLRRHLRDNHYRRPPYNHLTRLEHVDIAKAEAP
ncbi:hypothetical protein CcaCcLH18_02728 [Colletotrichum camelliae]|nr:hypothetical protein CcaCcLH18_02728 [Colletotrichum camelliae]